MSGTVEIIKEINQKSRVNNQDTVKQMLDAFLEVIKQKLNKGENINFKGYFTLKRSMTSLKGDKHCTKHEKAMSDYKRANKGKGIAAFAKSEKFRNLVQENRSCRE